MMDDGVYFYSDIKINDSFINKIKRALTSAILFVAAFIISSSILQFSIGMLARSLGYTTKVSYDVVRILPREWRHWSKLRVMAVYLMAPLFCIFLGLIAFNLLTSNTNSIKTYRLFFFWLMVCLLNISLGHLFFSPMGSYETNSSFYQTFAVVGSWLGFSAGVQTVFSVISIIVSVLVGVVIAPEMWRFSFSSRLIRTQKGKNALIFQIYVLPVIIGAPAVLALTLFTSSMYLFPIALVILNLMFIAVGMFIRNMNDHSTVLCNKDDVLNHFPIIEFAFSIAVWFGVLKYFHS